MRLALFGNPVDHSLSPLIHQYFAKLCGLELSYDKILVEHSLQQSYERYGQDLRGFNITVPCKEEAFALAHKHSERALKARACNTIINHHGVLEADNTDGAGLVLDLKDVGIKLAGARVLILGAGGAARGIIDEIYKEQVAYMAIANRTISKIYALQEEFPYLNFLQDDDEPYDLIINATSSSLKGDHAPIDANHLAKAQAVYDLMYNKDNDTIFTRDARALGVKHCYAGLGMLVCQAAIAFKLWTDKMPSIKATKEYLRSL